MLTYTEFLQHWDGPPPHVFLCRPNKAPLAPGWQRNCATPAQVEAHDGLIGLIPHSIAFTVLDCDDGQPLRLALAHPPAFVQPTQRHQGAHLYYPDTDFRPNGKWRWQDCAGEIRAGAGFVIAWPGLWDRLLNPYTPDCVPYADVLPHITVGAGQPPTRRSPMLKQTQLF